MTKSINYCSMQYTILLDGTETSLKSSLSLIEQFSKFSGLKPNFQKTSCVKIGSLKNTPVLYDKDYNLRWSQEPFTFLGVTFSVDLDNIVELNYDKKNK